jgi:hypothetical protein
MGAEIIILTLLLIILGPIIGYIFGGIFKGAKWATVIVVCAAIMVLEPLVVGLAREFAWKYVPIVLTVGIINFTLVLAPFYFFKNILGNSYRKPLH